MKCLSVWQPWAELIVMGLKDVENRTWARDYRGPLLIHAGRSMRVEDLAYAAKRYGVEVDRSALRFGAILGAVDLVDCRRKRTSIWHEPGYIGWYFENPRRLLTPIPYKGQLGLFEVADRLLPRSWHG